MNASTPPPCATINLKLLQTFLLVAEHTSFRKAAERSCRSQSAISAQVRALEEQIGVPLFHRTTRRVRLTAEGLELFDCVSQALGSMDGGLRRLQDAARLQEGRVTLACSPTIAGTRLAKVLAAFGQDHPGIRIQVREQTSADLLDSVRRLEVDFGIGPVTDSREFLFETLLTDPLYALVPQTIARGRQDTITLAELATMPVLLLNQATALRSQLDGALREQGLALDTRYEFAHAQTLVSMACAGLGAAILPSITLPAALDDSVARLRIIQPDLSRRIALVSLPGQSLSPAAARFADYVRARWPH